MAFVDALAAQVALAREQPAQARSRVRAALDRFPPGQPPQAMQVRLLALLARAELRLGETASAQSHAEQALNDARLAAGEISYTEGHGLALLAMGLVRQAQGDLQSARSAWRDSEVQLRQSLGDGAPATLEARRLLQTLPKR
jgi:ATP/maltotriose-dependent transcriptional regulator MalT